MLTMYDTTDVPPDVLPADGHAYAGYVDGHYQSFASIARRFPHAHLLSISVFGGVADCVDIEPGNPVMPAQAGAWVRSMLSRGVWRPCVYAMASQMDEVRASLAAVPRGSYRLWVASWPGPGAIVPAGFDAHQYTDHGPHGENYDVSVCNDDFFHTPPPPPPKPSTGIAHASIAYNLGDGHWQVQPAAGQVGFDTKNRWASAKLQFNVKTGEWRVKPGGGWNSWLPWK